jgi:hypothetical protein
MRLEVQAVASDACWSKWRTDSFLYNVFCALVSSCLCVRGGGVVGGRSNDLIASYGSSQDTMLAFDNEASMLKQAARFRKVNGEAPTKSELKVPWACLTLGS